MSKEVARCKGFKFLRYEGLGVVCFSDDGKGESVGYDELCVFIDKLQGEIEVLKVPCADCRVLNTLNKGLEVQLDKAVQRFIRIKI